MTIADLARRSAKFAIDNSPTILTTLGVVGAVTTAYLTGKASFEASDIIRLKEALDYSSEEDRREPKEVVKDRVQLVWKLYIPAMTMGSATVACIIGANRVHAGRAAGLAAAYTLAEKSFDEYKTKVVEKFGERKEEAVRDEIAQDRINETYLEDVKIIGAESDQLCYDMFADRYFRSTVETLRSAENEFNKTLLHNGNAPLADFYRILDLTAPAYSENIGWNSDRFMEIRISTTLAPGDIPCLSVSFRHDPLPDYGRFR